MPLPATALLSNRGTWAVPARYLPATTAVMLSTPSLSFEKYDLSFRGQHLRTTYFDTLNLDLVKARKQGDRYLTLRVRCYLAEGAVEAYALAGKTENEKWRVALTPDQADAILEGLAPIGDFLPGNLLARLMELAPDGVQPCVTVCCKRYAVEDDQARLTLDTEVCTDTGKELPACVLEFKSADASHPFPAGIESLHLRPIKLSKFLWAMNWR
jgi:hypothetical protein